MRASDRADIRCRCEEVRGGRGGGVYFPALLPPCGGTRLSLLPAGMAETHHMHFRYPDVQMCVH